MFFGSPDPNKALSSQSSDPNSSSSNIFGASSSVQAGNSVPASVSQPSLFSASAPSPSLFSNLNQSSLSSTPTNSLFGTAATAGPTSSNIFASSPANTFASNSVPSTNPSNNSASSSFSFSNNSNQGFGSASNVNNAPTSSNTGFGSSSLFGATTSTSAFGGSSGGGMFGTTGVSQNTNTGGACFGTSNSSQNSNSVKSLFGMSNPNNAPSQTTNAGSLFGTSNSAPNSSTAGGIFGTTNNTSGGFGATAPGPDFSNGRFPPQTAPATSLFSHPPTAPPGGIFGGGPQFGGYNGQNLFAQSGCIPQFSESGNLMARMPYNLTLSSLGLDSDLEIIVNDYDHYYLSSKVMSKASDHFKTLISSSTDPISIETPFPNSLLEVLFWLIYSSESKLFDYISSFKQILEVYSCFRLLKLNNIKVFGQRLINLAKSKNLFNNLQIFPESLSKEHVDFEFICEVIKNISSGLFGGYQNLVKCAALIEWLAERNCRSEKELKMLEESQEFAMVSKYIEVNNLIPPTMGDYALIVSRYPVGSKVYNLQIVLKGFGLLRV